MKAYATKGLIEREQQLAVEDVTTTAGTFTLSASTITINTSA